MIFSLCHRSGICVWHRLNIIEQLGYWDSFRQKMFFIWKSLAYWDSATFFLLQESDFKSGGWVRSKCSCVTSVGFWPAPHSMELCNFLRETLGGGGVTSQNKGNTEIPPNLAEPNPLQPRKTEKNKKNEKLENRKKESRKTRKTEIRQAPHSHSPSQPASHAGSQPADQPAAPSTKHS